MINITIKYFASLREQLGKSEECLTLDTGTSVAEVWQHVTGVADPENMCVALNMEYVKFDAVVKDGDELAFFPPVTGG